MGELNRVEFEVRFGEVKVRFDSYYKYSFCFKSVDGKLEIYAGGDKDDIYRFTVAANKEYSVLELPVRAAYWEGLRIYEEE